MNESIITEDSTTPTLSFGELAEQLANLEYTERRTILELADQLAASHYE